VSARVKLVTALIVVAGVIGVLVGTAATRASSFYVTVGELYAMGQGAIGETTSVSGNIVGRSVRWDPAHNVLQFSLQDSPQGRSLPVVFHGPKPDDFTNDWPVIVTGRLQPDGTFAADKLLIKCPSKYQAQEEPAPPAARGS
jgi:cytochrome c-type biogenesis protein CcmE